MTEFAYSKLVFQGAVGKDHHLWRSRDQVRSPELGGRGGEKEQRQWWEGSGSSEDRVVQVLLFLPGLSHKDLRIRFSERKIQQGESEGLEHVGKGKVYWAQTAEQLTHFLLTAYKPAMPCETQTGQNCLQPKFELIHTTPIC